MDPELPENNTPEEQEELPEQTQKMSRLVRLRVWLARLRRRRIRLLFGRSISQLTVLLLSAFLLFVFAIGLTFQITNRPIFCISCHEMDVHYATWRESTHKSVTCEECHVMPGYVNMFRSKINALYLVWRHQQGDVEPEAIQGHVPDASCKRCHPTTKDLIVYHSLKITHKKHWDRKISCTFCHDRVVHGPRVEPETEPSSNPTAEKTVVVTAPAGKIYPPLMETCFKCHDGKRISNNCSLCHVSLEQKHSTFTPEWVEAHKRNVEKEGASSCVKCHQQEFCNNCHAVGNPHPGNWRTTHPEGYRKDPSGCKVCHRAPKEKASDISMAFCKVCHATPRTHQVRNWTQNHAPVYQKDPKSCAQCHNQQWCSDCHRITNAHPAGWIRTHPATAKAKPDSCKTCHKEDFCIACHKGTGPGSVPPSHTNRQAWINEHKFTVSQNGQQQCMTCHTTEFCQTCHKNVEPKSHQKNWSQQHGIVAKADPNNCMVCHKQSYCNSCHGIQMPHPKNWVQGHPRVASKGKAAKGCQRCHQQSFCNSCHRGTIPTSHQPLQTWIKKHGKTATGKTRSCQTCHKQSYCDSCHGTKLPHPKGWVPKGHTAQAKTQKDMCMRCHTQTTCDTCHGVTMPHPGDFMSDHAKDPKASLKPGSACFKCHDQKEFCGGCHGT